MVVGVLKNIFIVFVSFAAIFILLIIRDNYGHYRAFLSKMPLFSSLIRENEIAKVRARAMALTFIEPDFKPLAQHILTGASLEQNQIEQYLGYYLKAREEFPRIAEVHAMLGFFYSLLDDAQSARKCYEKAVQLNLNFFWSYYNLGRLYFKEGDYLKALSYVQEALAQNKQATLKNITNSRVYHQIFWPSMNLGNYPLNESLAQGYREAEKIQQLIKKYLGKKNKRALLSLEKNTDFKVKIF